jgi:nucleotide-binding universal stress UspA family protein
LKEVVAMIETERGCVVVGVGESPAGLQALRYAVAEARRRGFVLRAVRAWQVGVPWSGYDVDLCRDQAGANADAMIRTSFDTAMGGLPRDLDFELIAVEGATGAALVQQARNDDDLLIVGAPRRRRWPTSLFTVDRYCTRFASCPVVVVPASALARELGDKAMARAIMREAQRYVEANGSSDQ